jgi:hypothetical protein
MVVFHSFMPVNPAKSSYEEGCFLDECFALACLCLVVPSFSLAGQFRRSAAHDGPLSAAAHGWPTALRRQFRAALRLTLLMRRGCGYSFRQR